MYRNSLVRSFLIATMVLSMQSACVTQEKYDDAVAERDAAMAEKARLQKAYDDLQVIMADRIAANEAKLTQLIDGVEIEIPSDVLFASGSARPSVSDASRDELIEVARYLKDSGFFISVVGHTDSRPPSASLARRYPTNWEMGAARAAIAARFFEEQGVDPTRIAATSRSQYKPVATNDTAAGRAQNRRVQIVVRTLPEDF